MFTLRFTEEAAGILSDMADANHPKLAKVRRAIARIEADPRQRPLQSHKWKALSAPASADLWESYVDTNTPAAWRIWWCYGPESNEITIVTLGKHP